MDLLGRYPSISGMESRQNILFAFFLSIMGSMDKSKPAPPSEKEKLMKKKKKVYSLFGTKSQFNFFSSQEYEAKLEERQKAEKLKFRSKIEEKINAFLKDDKSKTLKFPAMDKFQRFANTTTSPTSDSSFLCQVCSA